MSHAALTTLARDSGLTTPIGVGSVRLVRGHNHVTLYLGDCLEIAPTLTGVDAVISDPPYGIAFQHSGCGNGKGQGRWLAKTCTIHGDDKPFDPAPWLEYPIPVL